MSDLIALPSPESSTPPRPIREQFWREHIDRWQESGLTKSAYCRQEDLKLHQMSYWCQKLVATKQQLPSAGRFVPLQLRTPLTESTLSVVLPNGIVVRGITGENVELVGQLIVRL